MMDDSELEEMKRKDENLVNQLPSHLKEFLGSVRNWESTTHVSLNRLVNDFEIALARAAFMENVLFHLLFYVGGDFVEIPKETVEELHKDWEIFVKDKKINATQNEKGNFVIWISDNYDGTDKTKS